MKRFWYLVWYPAVLMAMASSADAGSSFSFMVGGHHIRIEAPLHCNSPSCVSVSIPGVYESRRHDTYRDRDDDIGTTADVAPARPAAPAPAVSGPAVQPACPSVAPVVSAAPAPVVAQLAPAPQQAVAPNPATSAVTTPRTSPAPSQVPPVIAPVETPRPPARPAPNAAPPVSRISHEADDAAEPTPVGDWQTEGKTGSVRIQPCGSALCGYMLDAASNTVGESVLINMKPKTGSGWSGNVYSRSSGETYYGTLAIKGANGLRVEACALGQFFCSGNLWSRIDVRPRRLVTSRQISPAPRS